MSRAYQGIVGPDGRSVTPLGVTDMAAPGEDAIVTPEIQARLKKLFNEEIDTLKAKFKLEIAFTEVRSNSGPYGGIVSAWTNGGHAHGGGDEAVYFCSGMVDKGGHMKTCNNPLDLKWVHKSVAVCPVCRQAVNPKDLGGQIYAKLTHQNWAILITRMFVALSNDADIRLLSLPGNLRKVSTAAITEKAAGPDDITHLRAVRKQAIYPLKNIVKDTAAGADLTRRILSFLST